MTNPLTTYQKQILHIFYIVAHFAVTRIMLDMEKCKDDMKGQFCHGK